MIIPANFGQVNFIFNGIGVPTGAEVTMGFFRIDSGKSAADTADELGDMWIAAQISLSMEESVDLAAVLVKFGPNATGASALVPKTDGGASNDICNPNTAFLVRKITDDGGRAGRGRFYLPGVPSSQVDDGGQLDTTWAANLQSALDDFHTAMAASDMTPVVLHGAGSPITTPSPVTSLQLDPRVATQRRRLRR
jgi:hypothetical protein